MEMIKRRTKRIIVGITGGAVLLLGIILIPYPGPGWLTVFAGLTILATEFHWASRVLGFVKRYYHAWENWMARQPLRIRMIFIVLTGLLVVVTIWLVNGFGMMAAFLGIDAPWVHSPFFR